MTMHFAFLITCKKNLSNCIFLSRLSELFFAEESACHIKYALFLNIDVHSIFNVDISVPEGECLIVRITHKKWISINSIKEHNSSFMKKKEEKKWLAL